MYEMPLTLLLGVGRRKHLLNWGFWVIANVYWHFVLASDMLSPKHTESLSQANFVPRSKY